MSYRNQERRALARLQDEDWGGKAVRTIQERVRSQPAFVRGIEAARAQLFQVIDQLIPQGDEAFVTYMLSQKSSVPGRGGINKIICDAFEEAVAGETVDAWFGSTIPLVQLLDVSDIQQIRYAAQDRYQAGRSAYQAA